MTSVSYLIFSALVFFFLTKWVNNISKDCLQRLSIFIKSVFLDTSYGQGTIIGTGATVLKKRGLNKS